ncbi:uncharacterized protein LOC126798253 [Argentina anserina]|uniref:uncharacterized protein LOC126798253 n=1 Tax=Argentina anserina TaxID=57926 RepID=UPI0021766AEE|nr:uncharacterized protein LOC126798253 [Potentilla anserina]
MGFLTFAVAGGALILAGSLEAIASSATIPSPSPPTTPPQSKPQTTQSKSSFIYFLFTSLLSLLFILNSLLSLSDAATSNDRVGSAQQLQVAAIAALFLLYSFTGLLSSLTAAPFPPSLLNLIGLFAFTEEFMYFYLQRKDTVGIENRYFDLLLVPILVCVVSTLLEIHNPESVFPKLGRGVGLVLQGLWFLQMGVSIYTQWMARGCWMKERSRGNYTVKCKGHSEYHRARAIATLQFNCHLALIVVLVVGVYSVVVRRIGGDFSRYKPLGAEMQRQVESQGRFTLDSDDDGEEEGRGEGNVDGNKAGGEVELGVNGYGAH